MTEYEYAKFWDYILTDAEGNITGVRNDIPESARKEYVAFLQEQQYAEEHHMKI